VHSSLFGKYPASTQAKWGVGVLEARFGGADLEEDLPWKVDEGMEMSWSLIATSAHGTDLGMENRVKSAGEEDAKMGGVPRRGIAASLRIPEINEMSILTGTEVFVKD
jgi:hypothetical protein